MPCLAPFLPLIYAYSDFPAESSRSFGMRSHALAFLLVLQLQTAQTPPGTQQQSPKGSIEGIVVRIGTAEPVPGARVTLSRVQAPATALPAAPPPPSQPPLPPAGAVISIAQSVSAPPAGLAGPLNSAAIPAVNTDSKGNFVFKDLDSGSYRIQVASNGYARTEYGQRVFGGQGTPVSLMPG